jgi:hypothetical protein
MKTSTDIIEEAIKWRAEEESYDNERSTTLGKFFSDPLFPFRKGQKSGGDSSVILYLSERLVKEMNARIIAEKQAHNSYRLARKCVSIYGLEAEKRLEDMWSKLNYN